MLENTDIKKVHFIGIGGISMSGLARILLSRGYTVTGSDMKESDVTDSLSEEGIHVSIGHSPENIHSPDLVVHTAAVDKNNLEILRARELYIPVIDRATLLGEIMDGYEYSLAVAGTHGKTTTTSMITAVMLEAGKDPTVHIGGNTDVIGGSVRIGGNGYFITEACEYQGSFLKLRPDSAVILNIEYDHADYFRDIGHIRDTFIKFAKMTNRNGHVIGNADDTVVMDVLKQLDSNIVTFGIDSESCTWKADNIRFNRKGCASFVLVRDGTDAATICLGIPGRHNISNALAAAAACYTAGCDMDAIRSGLGKFNGTGRRLEMKGTVNGIKIYDDYAHHPSEIKATLSAVRMISSQHLWVVFQPHTYTRTRAMLPEFAESFDSADTVVVTDIYAAREKDTGEIHSSQLVEKINRRKNGKAAYMGSFEEAAAFLKRNTSPGDIIITMGAGDIYRVGELFLNPQHQP